MVFKRLALLVKQKNQCKVLLAALKGLTNSKDCPVSRIKFLFRLSYTLIVEISPVYMDGRLSKQLSESQAAFGTTFKVTGGFRKSGTSPLKRVTGRIFPISK
jgi:hypothetical protein